MATNLFKPDAQRIKDHNDLKNALWSFLIFLLMIVVFCYIGYRASLMEDKKETVKTYQNDNSKQPFRR